jgi:hypothetical protein
MWRSTTALTLYLSGRVRVHVYAPPGAQPPPPHRLQPQKISRFDFSNGLNSQVNHHTRSYIYKRYWRKNKVLSKIQNGNDVTSPVSAELKFLLF